MFFLTVVEILDAKINNRLHNFYKIGFCFMFPLSLAQFFLNQQKALLKVNNELVNTLCKCLSDKAALKQPEPTIASLVGMSKTFCEQDSLNNILKASNY